MEREPGIMIGDAGSVSVIIPTYNRSKLLAQAIASVLGQTYPNHEIIVVDDGSTDDTCDYVASLGDPRVKLVRAAHSGHIPRVRNTGIARARGEWVAFLDSDDVWLPAKLERQMQAIRDSKAAWSYTRYEHVNPNGEGIPFRAGGWRAFSGNIVEQILTAQTAVTICSVLVSRALLEQLGGFDEHLGLREDFDLVLRLSAAGNAIAVPETLLHVREHEKRMTASLTEPYVRSTRAYDLFIERTSDVRLRRIARRVRGGLWAHAAAQALRSGGIGKAFRYGARSLRDYARAIA
jgi:glycosyltransferase involved in cell wall biosynthesis